MSFSLCSSFNITKLNCFCSSKKNKKEEKLPDQLKYIIDQQEHKFGIKKLDVIDHETLFKNSGDITLSIIINNHNEVISLAKNSIDKSAECRLSKNTSVDDLSQYLPYKLSKVIEKLHQSTVKNNHPVGCIIQYENFDYSLTSVPISIENNVISTIIIKKIYVPELEFLNNLDDI